MKLTPPKKIVWVVALILGIVGLVGWIVGIVAAIQIIPMIAFWVVVVGLALLLLSTILKGL